jgi:hypothetical protein
VHLILLQIQFHGRACHCIVPPLSPLVRLSSDGVRRRSRPVLAGCESANLSLYSPIAAQRCCYGRL